MIISRIFRQEKNINDVAAATPAKKAAPQLKKSSGAHPATSVMIKSAITALGDKKGSSLAAIKKYVKSNYHVDIVKISPFICKALKKGVESKNLVQIKRSYKLAKEVEKPTKSNKVSYNDIFKIAKKQTFFCNFNFDKKKKAFFAFTKMAKKNTKTRFLTEIIQFFSTFQVIVPKTKEVKKSKAKKAKSSNKKAAAKPKNVKKAATKPVKKLAAITKCGSGFSYT